jgi:hypothetical protein
METAVPNYNHLTFYKAGCQTILFSPAVWLAFCAPASGELQDKTTDLPECGC